MAREMSFYRWMMTQRKRDDPLGDLASDMARDSEFPKTAKGLRELDGYLALERGAGFPARDALSAAWRAWRKV